MAESNWKPIEKAEWGIGPLLLRSGPGFMDGVFIGYKADDGRWSDQDNREVHPTHFAFVPPFDVEEGEQ